MLPITGTLRYHDSIVIVVKRFSFLTGMDIQLADLFEDILYQSTEAIGGISDSRLFVIDTRGRTLAHPLLQPSAASSGKKLQLPPIGQLEAVAGFGTALHHMTSLPSGNYTTAGNVTYTWQLVR
jgi:hypothetical protein